MNATYEDYYQLALKITHNPAQQVSDWIGAAQAMAEQMYSGRPGAPPEAPVVEAPAGAPPQAPPAPRGNRFGAAFDGWDEVALIQILISAQSLVIARVGGATEEQLKEPIGQLFGAIDDLQTKYVERQGK